MLGMGVCLRVSVGQFEQALNTVKLDFYNTISRKAWIYGSIGIMFNMLILL